MPQSLDDLFNQVRGAAPASTGGDPLDAQWGPTPSQRAGIAATAMSGASPDAIGRANALARDTGLPPDTVDRNQLEAEAKWRRQINVSTFQSNPLLAEWAGNPRNYGTASDDMQQLAKVGVATASISSREPPAASFMSVLRGLGSSFIEGARQVPLSIQHQAEDFWNSTVGHTGWARDPKTGAFSLQRTPVPNDGYGRPITSETADAIAQQRSRQADATPQFKSWIGRSLYGGGANLVQNLPGIAASIATANPAPAIAVGALQAETQGYEDLRQAGAQPGRAFLGASAIGAIEAATEFLPTKYLVDQFGKRSATRFAAGFLGRELPTEELATVTQNAVQTAASPDATWSDYWSQLPADMRDTAVAVGMMSLTMGGAEHIAHRLAGPVNDIHGAASAVSNADAIDAMMSEAQQSKTRTRDPEAFRQFIAAHTEGTAAENLYVPADKLRELFQSDQYDPHDAAYQWLAGFDDQVREASALGGDVVIPMADAVTHLAGTQAWDALRPDARIAPGGMSESEARSFESDYKQQAAAHATAIDQQDQADREARGPERAVYDDVFQQLRQAGYTQEIADAYASLWAARYATRAATSGSDALTAYRDANVSIRRDAPALVEGYRSADQMDILINAMRSKERTPDLGPSLLDFISRGGGIEDRGGDITSMGGERWHRDKAFRRRLIREAADERQGDMMGADGTSSGYGLDDWAQRAWDEGYFPDSQDRPTTNDLLEAIGGELRGEPRHAVTPGRIAGEEADAALGEAAGSLRRFLSDRGLDPDTATRAQIDEAVARDDGDRQLMQSAVAGINTLIDHAEIPGHNHETVKIAPASEWLVDRAREHGLDIDGMRHTADTAAIRHARSQHGDEKSEKRRGQLPVREQDLRAIPAVLLVPDQVVFGLKNARGQDQIAYVKRLPDGTTLYIEEVRTGKKALAMASMRRFPGTIDATRLAATLDPHARSASRGALNIVDVPGDGKNRSFDQSDSEVVSAEGMPIARGRKAVEAFHRWFGDSKAATAAGAPITLFHGTDQNFEAFDRSTRGRATGDPDARFAFFLSNDPDVASGYAAINEADEGQNVIPAVVSIQNPRIVDWDGGEYDPQRFRDEIAQAKEDGNDGVVFRNVRDGTMRDEGVSDTYAVFSTTQIKSVHNRGTFSLSDARILNQSARGRIDLYDDGRRVIRLFENADLSTFLHESGHLWLEELQQDAAAAHEGDQLDQDWQAVRKWFSDNGHAIGEDGVIPTDAHELWARGFERYALEGKAPSTALGQIFDRFRSWLMRIYQVVGNLRAPITPEIREVFDRMIATREEIRQAEESQHLQALFTDAAQAGMTEDEFAAYWKMAGEARSEAYNQLIYRTMHAIRVQRTKEWHNAEKSVREEVSEQINARPEFRALHLLRTGRWLGEPDRAALPVKLDRDWLVDHYGSDAVKLLPKGVPPIHSETDGINPDDIAALVGFRSGDEMVRALMGIEEAQKRMRAGGDTRSLRDRVIADETAATMRERFGDPLNDGQIEELALAAVNNDRQGEMLAAEARALSRTGRRTDPATPYRLAREWARKKIGAGTVRDVSSRAALQRYARAAARAGRAAEASLIAGDVDESFRHKQAQLLNHALLTEAKIAADDMDAAVKRLSYLGRKRTLGSIDQDYLDRVHGLLEKFDFRQRSQRQVREQAGFAQWAAAQRANGIDVLIPPRLEDRGDHYSKISVEEMRGLRDTVEQLVELGRLKQKLIDEKAERDFDEVVAEAEHGASLLPQRPPSDLMEPSWKDRFASGVASADAALLKMEQVFDWLDHGNANGVFNRIVFQPLSTAQDRENDMMADYLGRVREAMSEIDKATLKRWSEQVQLPELRNRETGNPFVMTRQQLVAMALNMGNAGNIQRLTDGYGWRELAVRDVLNRELTADEWKFVQKVWDIFETLWPDISQMERRVNGFAPEKVEAVAIDTPGGLLRGGYYPAVYDTSKSVRAEVNAGKSDDLFQSNYTRASTRSSSTNERVEQVKLPILLHLGVINRHLGETIHDITHREVIINADKFLSAERVANAIDASLGPEIRQQFRPWLRFVANRWAMERAGNEGLGKWVNKARANTTVVGMGFRASTILSQIAGYSNSAEYVGAGRMASAIAAAGRRPVETYRFVMERSGEVRHRMDTLDRDINVALNQLTGKTDILTAGKRFAFHGIGYMDRVVAIPTWIAGYNKALAEGRTEEQAAYEGDKAVRLSQGAGSPKDLAAVQRGTGKHGELLKFLTMFYSYFSAFYQRERTLGRDIATAARERRPRDLPKLAARAFFLIAVPPVLADLLSGRGPDPDEDWGWWAFKKMLVQALGPIPLVKDLIEPAWDKLTGQHTFGFQLSPLQAAGDSIVQAAQDAHSLVTGKDTKHATKDVLQAAGYTTGLVPGQIASAAQFFVDVGEGDQDPQTVADWYRGITTGHAKPKDER
jgi:hypothetical protein